MYLPKLSNVFFFIVVTLIATLSFYWYDGYRAAKEQGQNITYPEYIKQQVGAYKEGFGQMADIATEARQSSDDITRGALNKIAEALFMYSLDTGEYPRNIEDLVGNYIKENNKIILDESFFYRRVGVGYEMGITLPVSGETYVRREK